MTRFFLSAFALVALLTLAPSCKSTEAVRPDETAVHVVRLQHVRAADLQKSLQELIAESAEGGDALRTSPQVLADERTNSLLIRSTDSERRQVLTLIARLDRTP